MERSVKVKHLSRFATLIATNMCQGLPSDRCSKLEVST